MVQYLLSKGFAFTIVSYIFLNLLFEGLPFTIASYMVQYLLSRGLAFTIASYIFLNLLFKCLTFTITLYIVQCFLSKRFSFTIASNIFLQYHLSKVPSFIIALYILHSFRIVTKGNKQ